MRYALAVVCPPMTLQVCGKPRQAIVGWLFFVMSLATGNVGVIIGLHFLQILWAWAVVGRQDAHLEAREFVHAIHLDQSARRGQV